MALVIGTNRADTITPNQVSPGVTGGPPGALADTINGLGGADVLNGGGGSDVVRGGVGNDTLRGAAGTDTLNAGSGADTLIGGLDRDGLTGGAGADIFRFAPNDTGTIGAGTADVIQDYNDADTIELTEEFEFIDFGTPDVGEIAVTEDEGDFTVTWNNGAIHQVLVLGADPTSDFLPPAEEFNLVA